MRGRGYGRHPGLSTVSAGDRGAPHDGRLGQRPHGSLSGQETEYRDAVRHPHEHLPVGDGGCDVLVAGADSLAFAIVKAFTAAPAGP